MKLIVLILAVVAIRYVAFGRSPTRYRGIIIYLSSFSRWLSNLKLTDAWLQLIILILPVLLLFAIFCWATQIILLGLLVFLANLLVVWYCLWPPSALQLDEEDIVKIDATEQSEVVIDQNGEMVNQSDTQTKNQFRERSERILWQANQNTFAVMFWFVLFAGLGAILYRMIALLANNTSDDKTLTELQAAAQICQNILDWIPARLTALAYVVAANFVQGFNQWLHWLWKGLHASRDMLVAVGLASMEITDKNRADETENRHVIGLTDRALIVWLLVIAIFTLGALVY